MIRNNPETPSKYYSVPKIDEIIQLVIDNRLFYKFQIDDSLFVLLNKNDYERTFDYIHLFKEINNELTKTINADNHKSIISQLFTEESIYVF